MSAFSSIGAEAVRLKSSVSIAEVIGQTVHLKKIGRYLVARCPFHDERTPSFYVYDDHYHCFGCGAHGDVIAWTMAVRRISFLAAMGHLAVGGFPGTLGHQIQPTPEAVQSQHRPTSHMFHRIWNQGADPAGTLVETYLRSRGGLTVPAGAPIRFHPRCQRGDRGLPGGPEYWPAMLALMTDPVSGHPVGLHRTYLLPDGSGKAPETERGATVLRPKMILGTWGVVRLIPDETVGALLGIAEGIESALSVMEIIAKVPTWAAGTQDSIRKFPVLSGVETLKIFADADDNGIGLDAARTCAARWQKAGRQAAIQLPPTDQDWNDVAQRLQHGHF